MKTIMNSTNNAKLALQFAIDDFSRKKTEYNVANQRDTQEMLMTSRVLKREVIDMADTMDLMTEIITKQNDSITDMKGILSAALGVDINSGSPLLKN